MENGNENSSTIANSNVNEKIVNVKFHDFVNRSIFLFFPLFTLPVAVKSTMLLWIIEMCFPQSKLNGKFMLKLLPLWQGYDIFALICPLACKHFFPLLHNFSDMENHLMYARLSAHNNVARSKVCLGIKMLIWWKLEDDKKNRSRTSENDFPLYWTTLQILWGRLTYSYFPYNFTTIIFHINCHIYILAMCVRRFV